MPVYRWNRHCFYATLLLALFALPVYCRAFEILVLQTSTAPYYEQAYQGFVSTAVESVSKRAMKSVKPDSVTRRYLSRDNDAAILQRTVRAGRTDLILAIGGKALRLAGQQKEIPVVYLLAPDGRTIRKGRANVTGVDMVIPPGRQLASFLELLPSVKTLGVIYDPRRSRTFVEKAEAFANMKEISVLAVEVRAAKEVPGLLADMAGRIDAFWMLPDTTVLTSNTFESMLLFSFENQIPLLTFAEKYVGLGATVAATFDIYDMGAQAGRMGRKIMVSTRKDVMGAETPEKVNLHFNNNIAAKMGLLINTAALEK